MLPCLSEICGNQHQIKNVHGSVAVHISGERFFLRIRFRRGWRKHQLKRQFLNNRHVRFGEFLLITPNLISERCESGVDIGAEDNVQAIKECCLVGALDMSGILLGIAKGALDRLRLTCDGCTVHCQRFSD